MLGAQAHDLRHVGFVEGGQHGGGIFCRHKSFSNALAQFGHALAAHSTLAGCHWRGRNFCGANTKLRRGWRGALRVRCLRMFNICFSDASAWTRAFYFSKINAFVHGHFARHAGDFGFNNGGVRNFFVRRRIFFGDLDRRGLGSVACVLGACASGARGLLVNARHNGANFQIIASLRGNFEHAGSRGQNVQRGLVAFNLSDDIIFFHPLAVAALPRAKTNFGNTFTRTWYHNVNHSSGSMLGCVKWSVLCAGGGFVG